MFQKLLVEVIISQRFFKIKFKFMYLHTLFYILKKSSS